MSQPQAETQIGIPTVLRQTADGVISLAAAHLKLANLELVTDLEARTLRIGMMAAIGAIGLIGYLFLMVALGLTTLLPLSRSAQFALLGGVHVVAAAIAAAVVSQRRKRALRLGHMVDSVSRSVTAVTDAVMNSSPAPASERSHG
jgi:uncharacterized membrane protein YqjE